MSDTIHELKPCPFCGGSGEIHPSCIGGFTYEAYVSCVECGCKSPSSHYEHKAFMPEHIVKAVENWNTRPELFERDKLIEQMREALKFSLIADEVRQTRNVCASDINDACETSRIKRIAALSAAERGDE